jgi:predicted RND superfamily exporter protein
MAIGAFTRTNISTAQNSFLDADDPAIVVLDKFRLQFGSDDSVLLVYRPKDGDIFSKQSLLAVRALTHDLENWENLDLKKYQLKTGEVVKLDDLKHIRRVKSLTNLRIQLATGDTLRSDRLIPNNIPDDPAKLAKLKQTALAQEDYKLAFYSSDGQYGAVLVETDFGAVLSEDFSPAIDGEEIVLDDSLAFDADTQSYDESAEVQEIHFKKADSKAYSSFYKQLKTIFSKYDKSLTFYPVGYAPLASFVQDVVQQSMVLNVGMLIIIILLLWSLFRSFSAVLWPIVTIVLSVIWVFGVFAWLGVTLSSMVTLTIMLVLAVGIADCVHVMSAYMSFRREGTEHHRALSIAYDKTGLAIFVTSVTTVAGIAALGFSELIPIRTFAMMSTLGVVMAFVFTLFLLPILLDLWHPGKPQKTFGWGFKLASYWKKVRRIVKLILALVYIVLAVALLGSAIGGFIAIVSILAYIVINWQIPILKSVLSISNRYPVALLAVFSIILAGCIYGSTQVQIDSNITELTREGSEVRVSYEVVDNHMAGTHNMEIMVDSNKSDGVLNPALLLRIDKLQKIIESNYPTEVGQTFSLANVVKQTNKIMHEDNLAYFRIPDTQQMIAQQLYLFNSANPDDRRSIVSDD